MKYLIKLVVVVLSALLLNTAAQSKETTFSEKVEKMCGIHPRVELFRQYKDATIKDQFLVHINECVTGETDISVLNWNITDGDLQGCLIKQYGYQETYVQNIADVYGKLLDSDEIATQIAPYNTCVNNIRKCGKQDCSKKVERKEHSISGKIQTTSTTEIKRHEPCLKVPSEEWKIDTQTVKITPPGGGSGAPRPWGAKKTATNEKVVCYSIWLSRYPSDPTSINWTITADIYKTESVFEPVKNISKEQCFYFVSKSSAGIHRHTYCFDHTKKKQACGARHRDYNGAPDIKNSDFHTFMVCEKNHFAFKGTRSADNRHIGGVFKVSDNGELFYQSFRTPDADIVELRRVGSPFE